MRVGASHFTLSSPSFLPHAHTPVREQAIGSISAILKTLGNLSSLKFGKRTNELSTYYPSPARTPELTYHSLQSARRNVA